MPQEQVSADQILKEVHDLREYMADENKTVNERVAGAEAMAKETLENLKEYKRAQLAPTTPAPIDITGAMTQRGGLFQGGYRLPYTRMLMAETNDPDVRASDREQLHELQTLATAMTIRYYYLLKKAPRLGGEDWLVRELQKAPEWPAFSSAYVSAGYARAANDILNPSGGEGAQLEFTLLTGQLIEYIRLATIVAAQFREVTLPRHKCDFPILVGDTRAKLGGTNLPATDASNIGGGPLSNYRLFPDFGQIEFDCKHCLGFLLYNDDMVEDSVVPIVPILQEQTGIMIARATDGAIINGDIAASMDSADVPAAEDFRRAWNGLRRLGQNQETAIAATIVATDISTIRAKMGKYGINPSDLVLFLSPTEWLRLLTDATLKTVDVAGIDRATLRTGVVDQVWGIDVVVTEEIRRDLNAGGDYDNVTLTKTIEILCNRTRFWLGRTRDVRTEMVRAPQALANWVQADLRRDFKPIDLDRTTGSGATFLFPAGPAPVAIAIINN